jgi:hypothetical protein
VDGRHGAGDLAGNKGASTPGGLVIEQDAVAGVHAVGLAVVDRDPVGVHLGDAIGRARVKGRGLALGGLGDLTVQLRGGCLIGVKIFWPRGYG